MKEMLKKFLHWALVATFWVFVLSIHWNNKPIFYHANEILVQNRIVATIDEQMGELWYKAKETAKVTWNSVTKRDDGNNKKI